MIDDTGLARIGLILAAITTMTMLVAGGVIQAHVHGQLTLEGTSQPVAAMSLQTVRR